MRTSHRSGAHGLSHPRRLIALIALFAHFYLETWNPQPQSSLGDPALQTLVEEGWIFTITVAHSSRLAKHAGGNLATNQKDIKLN